jgi:hypothetical protein
MTRKNVLIGAERDDGWADWYAEYIVREQAAKSPPT